MERVEPEPDQIDKLLSELDYYAGYRKNLKINIQNHEGESCYPRFVGLLETVNNHITSIATELYAATRSNLQ